MSLLKKQKRKELLGAEDGKLIDDTDDEQVLAERWVDALIPPTIDSLSSKNNTGRSIAIWFPMHRVAVVVLSRGKMMSSVGVTGDGELCLLPEEALYLAEKRYLTLYHGGDNNTKLNSFTEAKKVVSFKNGKCISDGLTCLSTNTEGLYSALTEYTGVSLGCYFTYRTLRDRLNYVVRRYSYHEQENVENISRDGDDDNGAKVRESGYHANRIHITKPIPNLPHYRPGMRFDEDVIAFETFIW